jgi:hypothetical protein
VTKREYTPLTRAAVLASLLTGQSASTVAREQGVPLGTVKRWSADAKETIEPVRSAIQLANQLALAELIMENLRAKLIATQRIAEYVIDPLWLQKQTAADVGELFEHIDRAATAILDRMAAANRRPDDADDSTEER